MIPTVYDICVTNVLSISIDKTLDEAIKKLADANLRTVVLENQQYNTYHILTTKQLLEFKIDNIDKNTPLYKLNIPKAKALDKNLNLLTVLNCIDFSDEYMVITQEEQLIGIVSYTDIVNNIDPQLIMEKQTISSLIHQYKAITTDEDTSTFEAIMLLKDSTRDALLILDEKYRPKGIFTTKDFIDVIHHDYDLAKPIKEYMTAPVETLEDTTTISKAIDYIKERRYKRIVVVNDKGEVSGVITQKELLRTFYNKWIQLIKEEGSKISKTNEQLVQVTSELKSKIALDHLTKLYNRNKFEEYLTKNVEYYSNNCDKETFSLLLLDIDNFKSLNDSFGHLYGDKVLQRFAKILNTNSRASDIISRWGGEEFVIILPETNLEQATIFAEKIRISVEDYKFEQINKITCSIGLAQFHNSDNKINLFKRADEALYRAKSLGKNRVEFEHL